MKPAPACERNDVDSPAPTHIISRHLSQLEWLRHASTCRVFDTRGVPRDLELPRLPRLLALPRMPVVHAQQRHTDKVGIVTSEVAEEAHRNGAYLFSATDALVCPVPGTMLAVFTADCVPVLVADTCTHMVAIVHAGWRGTLSRITEGTVHAMAGLGSSPANLRAWIGPSIGGCCYEVSEELAREFSLEFRDASTAGLSFRSGRLLDLGMLNVYQLHKAGVPWEGISTSDLCTLHHQDRFFTYRGEGSSTGRIISCIAALDSGIR